MPVYTVASDVSKLDPVVLADDLRDLLVLAKTKFAALDGPETASTAGKWSALQIVGHLCDSAMNNQQRIVRLQMGATLDFPGYAQEEWVRVQRYDLRTWGEVVGLFFALNEHLAHTVECMDAAAFGHTWVLRGETYTLGFIVEDYVAHLRHHLRQL